MKQMTWTLKALTIRGCHLPAHGPSRGHLLALHGWLDNGGSLLPLAECLPEFDWYLLDLPGHGHSDWLPPGLVYHYIDGVAQVCELIARHLPRPLGLVGHSMGAGMAPLVGVGADASVCRLVLLDGLGPLSSPSREAPEQLRRALQSMDKESHPRVYPTRTDLALAIAKSRALTPEQAEPLVARAFREIPEGTIMRHDPRLKWSPREKITEDQVEAFLKAVKQPVLLLLPEQGIYHKFSWQQREAHLRDLQVKTVPGGHHAHLENPRAVAEAIRDWWIPPLTRPISQECQSTSSYQ